MIDGWPRDEEPSLVREAIGIVAPQLRVGGYVMNDHAERIFWSSFAIRAMGLFR
ncbi:MAG TPA: hypothetical protein VNO32_17160 [Candidatus Acidoferrum sp.]|nr:hypothetical protein [Candidatus Acidoferrum sp.]